MNRCSPRPKSLKMLMTQLLLKHWSPQVLYSRVPHHTIILWLGHWEHSGYRALFLQKYKVPLVWALNIVWRERDFRLKCNPQKFKNYSYNPTQWVRKQSRFFIPVAWKFVIKCKLADFIESNSIKNERQSGLMVGSSWLSPTHIPV